MARRDGDSIFSKADALLRRHRGSARQPEPPPEFPLLTEIIEEMDLPLSPPASAPQLSEATLAGLERDLRLELLGLLGPEFERLIEAKVHERLGAKIEEILGLTRKVIEGEVRGAVREALAEVIAEEAARLKGDQAPE